MNDLILTWPCAECPHSAVEGATGTPFCKVDPNGDFTCDPYQRVETLAEWAEAVILMVRSSRAHFADVDFARDFAERQADVFADMAMDEGGEFDRRRFVNRCGYDARKATP
jgi:hypothetical protein